MKPLYKKRNKELLESYRPMYITVFFSKVSEKIIYDPSYGYFEGNEIPLASFNLFTEHRDTVKLNSLFNLTIYLIIIHAKMGNRLQAFAMYVLGHD